MEQEKLPGGDGTPHMGFDREVFARVWRQVMQEDAPALPPEGCAALPPEELIPPEAPQPAELPALCAPQAAVPWKAAPGADPRAIEPEPTLCNDVPCLGAASAIHGAQLQDFIDGELSDWHVYQQIARRAQGGGGRALSSIAADEKQHAKRLSTAYFLISGVRYWPIERMVALPCTYMAAIRQRFCAEQRGAAAYLAAAEDTADPCLRALYQELAGDENTHAWMLRGILEQL